MAGEEVGAEAERNPIVGWREKLEERWLKTKDHAQTYPYVWASYIVVYGGFGVYLAYRWRKLRRTEDRVRVLQERLRKLVQAEEESASNPAKANTSPPPPAPPPPSDKSNGR